MKKFFTLIAMAFVAVCASAQTITWTESDVKKGGLEGMTYGSDGFVLSCDVDTQGKMAVDANSQYFGDTETQEQFKYRLKSGATSGSKSSMSLTIPNDGTLYIYVRSGSGDATDRNLVLTQNETEIYNKIVKDEDAVKATPAGETAAKNVFPIISLAVKAGKIAITYPNGSLNFYGLKLVAGSTGIKSISSEKVSSNAPAFNLAGQRVAKDAKGLVIVNGKKHLNK